MAVGGGPFPINEGLVFGIDTGYPAFSNNKPTIHNQGRPTTNVSSGYGMSVYNNSGANISISLNATSETYKGATVYRQILTPVTSTGVSHLSGGNNPGVGVVTSGGGGTGGVYTGHSIFFRPTVAMHSSPIFTNYSNIGGWQSSNQYEYVGDGWYRAFVIWYDSVTRSDGKYWAINPRQAVLNQSITIDWAGPFRENLNSPTVSPFVYSSRETNQSLIDLKKSSDVDVSNISFDSTNTPRYDGSNDYTGVVYYTNHQYNDGGTLEAVVYLDVNSGDRYVMGVGGTTTYGASRAIRCNGGYWSTVSYGSSTQDYNSIVAAPTGTWQHIAFAWSGTTVNFYLNGTLYSTTKSGMITPTGTVLRIGNPPWGTSAPHNGLIPIAKHYNRALSTAEIQHNLKVYKTRFVI